MKNIVMALVGLLAVTANAQCWQEVSAGNDFTIAIKDDGTLWSWGDNDGGQLGDGTTVDKHTITPIGFDTDWQSASGGNYTSYALKTDGTLWSWGIGPAGQLGNGQVIDTNTPAQAGIDTDWQTIKAGNGHAVALKSNGTIWAWGFNAYGQVGDGTNVNKNIPIQVGTANDWQLVTCGFRSSFAIKANGTLWAWGRNDKGQLGDGTNTDKNIPVQVDTATNWYRVSTNGEATLALKTDGTLWSWGSNQSWQLGTGEFIPDVNVPTQVGTATNWQAVSAGAFHSVALKTNGTLWVWGEGFYGFGDGTNTPKDIPTQIGPATNWQVISAGGVHTVVLKTDHTLWTWGWNHSGQIANGTTSGNGPNNTQTLPIQVGCLPLATEAFTSGTFKLFPNPTRGILFIENKAAITVEKIKLTDLTGKILFEAKSNVQQINMQPYQNGIYILSITSERIISKYKIVKQ